MMMQAIKTPEAVDLSSRAMLVGFKVSQWSGRKLDKKVTREINEAHNAAADAGRYNKSLIARDALKDLASIVGAARNDHVRLTLPWLQDGTRILPAAMFQKYSDTMRKHREAFDKAKDEFLASYPDYVDQAKVDLNGLFNPADYPSAGDIRARFSWATRVLPMPDAADFRVSLADDVVQTMKADIAAQMDAVVSDAMSDAWQRLFDVVQHMATKLDEYTPKTDGKRASGVFRDSLVENVRDLVDILPALNLTGDARLAAMVEDVRRKLTDHDADTLRSDDVARADVAQAAADICDQMAAFMGA